MKQPFGWKKWKQIALSFVGVTIRGKTRPAFGARQKHWPDATNRVGTAGTAENAIPNGGGLMLSTAANGAERKPPGKGAIFARATLCYPPKLPLMGGHIFKQLELFA